jgi:uncharacterized membrane protein YidH (DUF202 family)
MSETYHNDFWLTVGAAAPLILLAQAVTLKETVAELRTAFRAKSALTVVLARTLSICGIGLAIASTVMLVKLFGVALRSMGTERDRAELPDTYRWLAFAVSLVVTQGLLPALGLAFSSILDAAISFRRRPRKKYDHQGLLGWIRES